MIQRWALFRRLSPFIRTLQALTAVMLLATLCPDPSWAQTKVARVGILNDNDLHDWLSTMHFYQTLSEHGWVQG
jgi:hypothetical protein